MRSPSPLATMHPPGLTPYLMRWQDAFDRGELLEPEDLCPDQPEVAEQLRPLIQALRERRSLIVTGAHGAPTLSYRAADPVPANGAASEAPGIATVSFAGGPALPPVGESFDPFSTGPHLSPQVSLQTVDAVELPDAKKTRLPEPTGVPGYEILGTLGRGGMGVVYKVRQLGLNRVCALKMILSGGHAGEAELARFRVEAEAIARLQHPNIVAVYEIGEHAGQPFFSLEFCSGGSLDRRLKGTPLANTDAARLVQVLAEAMQAAHQANVIHRDLKPANVLLQVGAGGASSVVPAGGSTLTARDATTATTIREYIPKITDFGLAKKLDDVGQTHTGAVMGTPSYMAPEQAEGRTDEVGPLADVYALGAILYECLTGRPPFRAATAFDTIRQVIADEPVAPRQLNPKIDGDLETICLKCLRKEPEGRYASAALLADDLGRFLNDEPITARPISNLEWAIKWARRRPTTAALFASIVVAVVLGCVGGVFYGLYKDQQSRMLAQQVQRNRQTTALFGEGQEAEADARLALAAGRDLEAEEALRRAESVLDRAVAALSAGRDPADDAFRSRIEDRLAAVRQELHSLRRRQEEKGRQQAARQQLQEQIVGLGQQRDELLFHHLGVVASDEEANRAAVRTRAAAALTSFRLAPGQAATAEGDSFAPFVRHFVTDEERRQTALACFEVLLVWAQTERTAVAGRPDAERLVGLRLAGDLLERARGLAAAQRLPIPRSWFLERANLLSAQGKESAAQEERQRANRQASTTALDEFLLALDAYHQGHMDRVLTACEEALRRQPGYFWPHYLQGLCHLKERRWAQADAWLSTCISQRPDFFWPRVLRASARVELNNLAAAESDLAMALRQAATPTMRHLVHLNRSRLAIVRKQWQVARDELKAAIACQPAGGYQAHTNLAQVYRQLGDLDAARGELDRAVAVQPADGRLYYTRAQVFAQQGNPAAARADFERAIRQAGAARQARWLASAHVELGYLKYQAGQPEPALAEYAAALKVVEHYPPAYRQQAAAYLALGRQADAGRALDAYLAAGGEPTAAVYRARGLIHAALREYAPATLAYSRALQLEDDPGLLSYRGWAYLQSQALPLALADFEAALKAAPDDADALCGRGHVRALTGQVKQAQEDVEAVLRKARPTSKLLCNLACIHAHLARRLEDADSAGRRAGPSRQVRLHEDRAVELIAQAIKKLPAEQRARFLREQVERDPGLRSLVHHPQFPRLAPAPEK